MITPSSAGRSVQDPVGRRLRGAGASARLVLGLAGAIVAATAGCAHGPAPVTQPAAPVTHLDMEPIHITATKGPEGVEVESYDASDLFDQASKALAEKRYDDAIATYARLQNEFQDERYSRPALYNVGLAYQGKKDWNAALASFRALVDKYPDTGDAKDALFQMGATYAELEDWTSSLGTFAQILTRKDLTSDDRLEALARRGYAQVQMKDLDTAEHTFTSAVVFFHQVEATERLETDFYLALSLYELGEISHDRFRAIPLRLPEAQMDQDLDREGAPAPDRSAPVHRHDQARQRPMGLSRRIPDWRALRGALRLVHARPHAARVAAARGSREAGALS